MKIIKTKEYDVINGTELYIPLVENQDGNTVVGETYIQTSTNVPFTVAGSYDGTNYQGIKLVNMGTYQLAENITNAGCYLIPSGAFTSIKLTATGAGKVFIKELY